MPCQKGESIITQCDPWHVVPLTDDDIYLKNGKGNFPRFSSSHGEAFQQSLPLSESVQEFLEKVAKSHQYSSYEIYELKVAFSLVDSSKHTKLKGPLKQIIELHSLTKRSWVFVQEKIDYDQWEHLLSAVRERMIIVHVEHPLMKYATETVPSLNEKELTLLIDQIPGYSKGNSALAVIKFFQDHLEPRMYAVIDPDLCIDNYQHSCAPSSLFELSVSSSGRLELSLVALYDINDESEISVRLVENDESVENREAAVQRRTGNSCGCLRCRYEVCSWEKHPPDVRIPEAVQLGHYYFSTGDFVLARKMYEMTLALVPDDPDLWHALGAISLSERKFLQAQRTWRTAAEKYPSKCANHRAITLQLDKIASYGYLSQLKAPSSESPLSWHAVVPQAFVTNAVVNRETCQQVIRWAKDGVWTTQRHYAVPTHDVPIHSVPELLEWFKHFHIELVQPLLANQFGLSPSFYVHDAFCVKYEGGALSNYLPIHIDESTHSFVLALSDDYEGGGTYFYENDTTVHLAAGDLLSFKGDSVYHGGEVLSKGIRYIIAAFLYHDDEENRNSSDGECLRSKRDAGDLISEFRKSKEQKASFSFQFGG